MARPPDALNRRRDRFRRIDLTHQIDRANVDPQLQRRRGDNRFQLTPLEPLLSLETFRPRKAPMMGRDGILAETLLQARARFAPPSAGSR